MISESRVALLPVLLFEWPVLLFQRHCCQHSQMMMEFEGKLYSRISQNVSFVALCFHTGEKPSSSSVMLQEIADELFASFLVMLIKCEVRYCKVLQRAASFAEGQTWNTVSSAYRGVSGKYFMTCTPSGKALKCRLTTRPVSPRSLKEVSSMRL